MRFERTAGLCALCLLVTWNAAHAQGDAENSRDNPYLARMANFFIEKSSDRDSGTYSFSDGKGIFALQGKMFGNLYRLKEGANRPSMLHIRRHYIKAIKEMGGEVIYEGRGQGFQDSRADEVIVTGRIIVDDKELWVEVWPYEAGPPYYNLVVLEKVGR